MDGTLTPGKAFDAGGTGAHLNSTDPNAGDPLASQGAVVVADKYLFTVNAGSNTAVMFAINPAAPIELAMVGQPVPTGGEFPVSIAVSKYGQVCVLNGGAVANVNCFKADPVNGLTTIPNSIRSIPLNQTTPPQPQGTASQIAFNADGTVLLAAIKGVAPAQGYIASWTIAQDGTLSQDYVQNVGGYRPFSITLIPGTNAIFDADPAAGGYNIWDFSQTPATSKNYTIPGQMANCWSAFSPKTKSFFLIDAGIDVVSELSLDTSLTGTVVKQYQLPENSGIIDAEVGSVAGTDYLYVLAPNTTSIHVLGFPAQGQGKPVQNYSLSDFASASGVPIQARNLQGMAVFTLPY
ncbi:hypothetical protein FRB99_008692 [Tulasnella sp. 403]|nr:hypothetical protein FRB99_008692 [Tulasnella sp. 403]